MSKDNKKTSSQKQKNTKSNPSKKGAFLDTKKPIHTIMPIVLGVFSAVLFLSMLPGALLGPFGEAIASFFLGILGKGFYLLPFFFGLGAFRWRGDVENKTLFLRMPFGIACSLYFSSVFYTFGMNETQKTLTEEFYTLGKEGVGGGFIGSYVGHFLENVLSFPGTIILFIAMAFVFAFVFLHFRPVAIFRILKNKGRLYSETKEKKAEEKAKMQERAKLQAKSEGTALAGSVGQENLGYSESPVRTAQPQLFDIDATEKETHGQGRTSIFATDEPIAFTSKNQPISASEFFAGDFKRKDFNPDGPTLEDMPVLEPVITPPKPQPVFDPDRPSIVTSPFGLGKNNATLAKAAEKKNTPKEVDVLEPVLAGVGGLTTIATTTQSKAVSENPGTFSFNSLKKITDYVDTEIAYKDFDEDEYSTSREGEIESTFINDLTKKTVMTTQEDTIEEDALDEDIDIDIIDDDIDDDIVGFDEDIDEDIVEMMRKSNMQNTTASLVDDAETPFAVQLDNPSVVVKKTQISTPVQPVKKEVVAPKVFSASYRYPPLSLLDSPQTLEHVDHRGEIEQGRHSLVQTLENFKIPISVVASPRGPRITRYEIVPEAGIRVRSIVNLEADIAMGMAAYSVRIEAPIPGKSAVGIEVPNRTPQLIYLRQMLDTEAYRNKASKTYVCLGSGVTGDPVYADLASMPHLLVAGATGMGKSVCINAIILSLLYKARPDEVKMIMIDPKKVEMGKYSSIPHLLVPVVTDVQKAAGALTWAVNEMERRYALIDEANFRSVDEYNASIKQHPGREYLYKLIIFVDELNELMTTVRDTVETSIMRIAQKARAAGIHLVLGTQRPSVDVITGTVKANIPARIAFHTFSQIDSRTILDVTGSEKLLDKGDMLFISPGFQTPKRVQGAFVSTEEVDRVTDFLKQSYGTSYNDEIMENINREAERAAQNKKGGNDDRYADIGDSDESQLCAVIEVALAHGKVSTSLLQRKMQIGYGKAAKLIDDLQERGFVSEPNGQRPRDVLITRTEYNEMKMNGMFSSGD